MKTKKQILGGRKKSSNKKSGTEHKPNLTCEIIWNPKNGMIKGNSKDKQVKRIIDQSIWMNWAKTLLPYAILLAAICLKSTIPLFVGSIHHGSKNTRLVA